MGMKPRRKPTELETLITDGFAMLDEAIREDRESYIMALYRGEKWALDLAKKIRDTDA